jgi:MATE family multidrug resistance protein
MFVTLFIAWVFRFEIGSFILNGKGSAAVSLVAAGMTVMFFSELFSGTQLTAMAVLRGYKDTQIPFLCSLAAYGICFFLSWYFCVYKKMGVEGIWLGITFGMALQAAFSCGRFILKFNPNSNVNFKFFAAIFKLHSKKL